MMSEYAQTISHPLDSAPTTAIESGTKLGGAVASGKAGNGQPLKLLDTFQTCYLTGQSVTLTPILNSQQHVFDLTKASVSVEVGLSSLRRVNMMHPTLW